MPEGDGVARDAARGVEQPRDLLRVVLTVSVEREHRVIPFFQRDPEAGTERRTLSLVRDLAVDARPSFFGSRRGRILGAVTSSAPSAPMVTAVG